MFRGGDGLEDGLSCFADGLVVGLSRFGETLEEDLHCSPILGVLVEVVVLEMMELASRQLPVKAKYTCEFPVYR